MGGALTFHMRETFSPELEPLLAPISEGEPCGAPVRYDPAFLQLRQSREEDDPSLPMGEWERPLKRADWRAVAVDCAALLGRSKDLLLAGWLCDAWVRQHQIQGFNAGADLLIGLAERYWDCLHPQIEDGDSDARVAPYSWMNEALPLTLRVQVPLVFMPDRKPAMLNLAEWEQVIVARDGGESKVLTREELIAMLDTRNLHWLADMRADLDLAIGKWDTLARTLDDRLALDAPSLGKVADTLRKLQRACTSLLDGRDPRAASAPSPAPAAPATYNDEEPAMSEQTPAYAASAPADEPVALPTGAISNRQEAYRMLEAAAAYLARTEPHSPTPYLVKRAVSWGQMSLADLMREILREEGDLSRYFSLLGLNPPQD
jgi:type VI secretion system protein ImpA